MSDVPLTLVGVGVGVAQVFFVWWVYRARIAELDLNNIPDRQELGRAITVMIFGKVTALIGMVWLIVQQYVAMRI